MTALKPLLRADFWLRPARWLVIAFTVASLALSLLGALLFPAYIQEHYVAETPNDFWTAEQTQAALAELGWPATTLAWAEYALELFLAALSYFFALFFLWRVAKDWFGLFLTIAMLTQAGILLLDPVLLIFPGLIHFVELVGTYGWQLFFIVFYVFPDGHFVPRWTRWMPLAWLALNLAPASVAFASAILLVSTVVASQVYRYRRYSTPLQRQQTKWLLAVFLLLLPIMVFIMPLIFREPPESALGPAFILATIGGAFFRLILFLIPTAIFIAIVRYRLWDVDVIIRKTLVYGVLSGLLALVYFGSVILLQTLFGAAMEDSPLLIVLSTLLIAALFSTLRRRVQQFIDRRFYRSKYDAARTLAEFAKHARDEVELEALSAELVRVVGETMQPEQVSLWLRDAGSSARELRA